MPIGAIEGRALLEVYFSHPGNAAEDGLQESGAGMQAAGIKPAMRKEMVVDSNLYHAALMLVSRFIGPRQGPEEGLAGVHITAPSGWPHLL
jgi:hypothetical protein